MYRLMKSAKLTLDHLASGPMSSYRHSLVAYFFQSCTALAACKAANQQDSPRHYVLNESGQEYFRGTWID